MEKLDSKALASASAIYNGGMAVGDGLAARGWFDVVCRDKDGNEKWRDIVPNVVTTLGKNLLLDSGLAGAAYTVTGPFMGLISSISYGAGPVAADTMASHAGWTEAGVTNAPTYTIPRKTCVWSVAAAGVKALSAALAFTFTGAGTIKGVFIVYGSGALSTVDNTAGTLFSGGLFSGGDKVVASTDVVNANYSIAI